MIYIHRKYRTRHGKSDFEDPEAQGPLFILYELGPSEILPRIWKFMGVHPQIVRRPNMELVSPLASARSICWTMFLTCLRCRLCTAR